MRVQLQKELKDKAGVCCGIEDFFYGACKCAIDDNIGELLQFGRQIRK